HRQKTVTQSSHQKEINTLLKETGFSSYDKKGLYEANVRASSQSLMEKKLAPRTARFRTFVKDIATPGSVDFDNIKILVIKESRDQLLGWRIYERR
ncbi:MAG TPA: hypothetical protein VFV68_02945, partial [Agriterribacter sp.]|nr:hypothetical protein [Agriterribacter sp.]